MNLSRLFLAGIFSLTFLLIFRFEALVPLLEMCIIREMYRAEVEPMPSNPTERVARSGLWKRAIYEGERFVRTDKENMIISVAEKLAEDLNYKFGHKRKGSEPNDSLSPQV